MHPQCVEIRKLSQDAPQIRAREGGGAMRGGGGGGRAENMRGGGLSRRAATWERGVRVCGCAGVRGLGLGMRVCGVGGGGGGVRGIRYRRKTFRGLQAKLREEDGGGGRQEVKQETEEEEKMRLLQAIKDNSNGPEQAKRRIEQLDKMVSGLKKRRRQCGEQIAADKERLHWLKHEIGEVEKQRKKLQDVLDDRKRRRDAAQTARDAIYEQLQSMSRFMDSTRSVTPLPQRHSRTSYLTQKIIPQGRLTYWTGGGTRPF